jgi:hypothetical protein
MGTTNAANAVRLHHRTVRLLITVLATLSLIATQLAVFAAQPADADPGLYVPSPDVAPAYTGPATRYVVDGNPNCAALAATYGFEADGEIKFDRDPSPGASITQDGVTVTITARYTTRNGVPGLFFDYEVTGGVVEGALMKQGPGGLFHLYAPNGVTADQGLHSQERNGVIWAGVSHISFCYAKTPPPSTGQIALDKVDAEGRRLAGATLQLFEGSPGSLGAQVGTDCVTDGTAACTFAPLPFGTYTAVEAAAPAGYRLAGSTPRGLTLTTSSPDLTESWTFSNERIPYRISVDPDAVNPVGDPHEFTVLVEYQDEQGAWQPLPDADLTLGYAAVHGFGEAGSIVAVEAGTVLSATSATCTTADGAGALATGTCVVTVNSGTPAKGELTATFATPYQHATSPTAVSDTTVGAAGVPGAIADSATKEWQGLHVDIAEDGVNLAGSPHPFTVTVTDSDGDPLPGASVTVEWDGPTGTAIDGTTVGDDGDPVEVTFTTGSDGTVTFSVTSDAVTSGTATVTKVVALVDGQTLVVPSAGDPNVGQLAIDFSDDDVLSASKDWIDYRVEISGDAVNYIEWAHTFTISVYELTPDGPAGGTLRPGATVTADWETTAGANGVVAADRVTADDDTVGTCQTGADGTCTITVEPTSGEVPSSGTLTVTSVGNVGVDADGVVDPSGTGGVAVMVDPADATKEWVDYGVDVTPDGVNPIGTADPDDSKHTFTVTVSRSASSLDAGSDLSGIVVDLLWQGDVGSIVEVDGTTLDPGVAATTCVTDAAGTCTVVVDSDEVGSGSLIVMGLTDDGVSDDANDAAAVTFLAEQDLEGFVCPAQADGVARICATKTWIAIELVKEATGGVELDGDTKYVMVDPSADPADTEVRYTYWITNPGPDPLELTTLVDDRIGDISAAMIAAAEARYDGSTVMPVGDTLVVADVPYALTAEDVAAGEVENVAVVTGRSTVDPDVEVTAEDDEVVEIREDLRPAISLVKTATDADVPFVRDAETGQLILFFDRSAGIDSAEVTYTYVITNIGNEPLVDLTLLDDKIGVLDGSITVARLDVGESTTVTATYTTTPEDLEAIFVTNVATTTGTGENSGEEVDDVDDETVEILEVFDVLQPRIQVVKDAVAGVTVGDNGRLEVVLADTETATVTYRFVVTNTGSDDLTDLTLVDDKIGDLTDELTAAVVAAYGELVLPVTGSVTFTADHVVRVSDFDDGVLTNVVVVEGTGVETGTSVTDDDDETVVLIQVFDAVIVTPARTTSTSTPLPRTGLDAGLLTALGVALTMLGLAALLGTERRRRRQE